MTNIEASLAQPAVLALLLIRGFDGTVFHRFGRCRHSIPAVVETHTRFPAFLGMTTVDVFGSPVAGWVVRWLALQTVRKPHVKTAIARAAVAVLMAAKSRPGALSRERYGLLPRSTKRMRDTGKHRLVGMSVGSPRPD